MDLSKQQWKHIGLGGRLLRLQRGFLEGDVEEELKDEDESQVDKGRVDKVDENRVKWIKVSGVRCGC